MKDYYSSINKVLKCVMVKFDKFHGFPQKEWGGRGSQPRYRRNEANTIRMYFLKMGATGGFNFRKTQ